MYLYLSIYIYTYMFSIFICLIYLFKYFFHFIYSLVSPAGLLWACWFLYRLGWNWIQALFQKLWTLFQRFCVWNLVKLSSNSFPKVLNSFVWALFQRLWIVGPFPKGLLWSSPFPKACCGAALFQRLCMAYVFSKTFLEAAFSKAFTF